VRVGWRSRGARGPAVPASPTRPISPGPACTATGIKQDHTTGLDPLTGREEHLFNPRAVAGSEDFAWPGGFAEIVATTAVGRATVWRLRLNRSVHKHHRRLLLAVARGGVQAWP
jgi:hypothetical protein